MHPTRIDLPADARERLIELLDARLADALDLKLQAKQAHWNVRGPLFVSLHALFDAVAAAAAKHADALAERAAQLGGIVHGTVRLAAQRSSLAEYPADVVAGRDHCDALATTLARFGTLVRDGITTSEELDDAATADLLTEIVREVDLYLWQVEAHLHADS